MALAADRMIVTATAAAGAGSVRNLPKPKALELHNIQSIASPGPALVWKSGNLQIWEPENLEFLDPNKSKK